MMDKIRSIAMKGLAEGKILSDNLKYSLRNKTKDDIEIHVDDTAFRRNISVINEIDTDDLSIAVVDVHSHIKKNESDKEHPDVIIIDGGFIAENYLKEQRNIKEAKGAVLGGYAIDQVLDIEELKIEGLLDLDDSSDESLPQIVIVPEVIIGHNIDLVNINERDLSEYIASYSYTGKFIAYVIDGYDLKRWRLYEHYIKKNLDKLDIDDIEISKYRNKYIDTEVFKNNNSVSRYSRLLGHYDWIVKLHKI